MSNSIQITINRSDIGFLLEAIELRSNAMIEAIMGQVLDVMQPEIHPAPQTNWTVSATSDGGLVAKKASPKKRKSRKGIKLPATTKTAAAPWGLKKDGTPKARPGRHPMGMPKTPTTLVTA